VVAKALSFLVCGIAAILKRVIKVKNYKVYMRVWGCRA